MTIRRKIFSLLFFFVLLVPLGLLTQLPAWGEWSNAYYEKVLGYIPKGIAEAKGLEAPMPDYAVSGMNSVIGYYLSALIGAALIFGIFYLIARAKKQ